MDARTGFFLWVVSLTKYGLLEATLAWEKRSYADVTCTLGDIQ